MENFSNVIDLHKKCKETIRESKRRDDFISKTRT